MALVEFSVKVIDFVNNPNNLLAGHPVEIRTDGAGTPLAAIFSDEAGLLPITQPGAVTSSIGIFQFYAESNVSDSYTANTTIGGQPYIEKLGGIDHSKLSNLDDIGGHDGIYSRNFDTLSDAKNAQFDTAAAGSSIIIKDDSSDTNSGGAWDIVLTSSVDVNPFNIVQSIANPLISFKEREAYLENNKYKDSFKGLEVLAHRGLARGYPENTLISSRMSPNGVDGIEFDVQLTSDKSWICMHDDTVDATTDGTGLVSSFTLASIQALDAGSWFDPVYTGARVPLASDMAKVVRINRAIPIIEVKEAAPSNAELKNLIDTTRQSVGGDYFVIACTDLDILDQCRAEDKQVNLLNFWLTLEADTIARNQALQPCIAAPIGSLLSEGFVPTLNASGLYIISATSTGQSITNDMLTKGAAGTLTDSFVGVRK